MALSDTTGLIADPVVRMIEKFKLPDVYVAEIDADLSDTAAFCEHYHIGMDVSANCIVVEAKRGDEVWYAACVVLATTRADINGIVRRHLGARKASFAPMDTAVTLTGMEYGGIAPIGLPDDWPILVDSAVSVTKHAIIGSGRRTSKLLVSGQLLATLPNAIDVRIKNTD